MSLRLKVVWSGRPRAAGPLQIALYAINGNGGVAHRTLTLEESEPSQDIM